MILDAFAQRSSHLLAAVTIGDATTGHQIDEYCM